MREKRRIYDDEDAEVQDDEDGDGCGDDDYSRSFWWANMSRITSLKAAMMVMVMVMVMVII